MAQPKRMLGGAQRGTAGAWRPSFASLYCPSPFCLNRVAHLLVFESFSNTYRMCGFHFLQLEINQSKGFHILNKDFATLLNVNQSESWTKHLSV